MKRRTYGRTPQAILALMLAFGAACGAQDLRIAAAANLSGVLGKLTSAFSASREEAPVIDVAFGSSGALASQIRAGAPFDVFLSADTEKPELLAKEGFAESHVTVYALGVLCIASRHGVDAGGDPRFLMGERYRKIAVASPELAPYGRAATEALGHADLLSVLSDRIVYGTNISQVNRYVVSGAADAGFVNLSAVLGDPAYAGIPWARLSAGTYAPIEQGAVVLRRSSDAARSLAKEFLAFLRSPDGEAILEEFGYGTAGEGSSP